MEPSAAIPKLLGEWTCFLGADESNHYTIFELFADYERFMKKLAKE